MSGLDIEALADRFMRNRERAQDEESFRIWLANKKEKNHAYRTAEPERLMGPGAADPVAGVEGQGGAVVPSLRNDEVSEPDGAMGRARTGLTCPTPPVETEASR